MGLLDIGSRPQSIGLLDIGLRKNYRLPTSAGNSDVASGRISKCFHRSKQELKIISLNNKDAKKIKNHRSMYRKHWFDF
jgi:hypothetical protein